MCHDIGSQNKRDATMNGAGVWLFGAGGHAKVVIDCAQSAGIPLLGVFDDDPSLLDTTLCGHRVLGGQKEAASMLTDHPGAGFVIAIAQNDLRASLAACLPGAAAPALVHAWSMVERSVSLGGGTVVFPGAVINADTRIGHHVIVDTSASIDHDCVLGDFVHIGPGARICSGVRLGAGTWVGPGCVIAPGVKVGASCVLGAGALVLESISSGTRMESIPAHRL
ncbi:MAG: acetyltransferase [Betaproteobacteria bacterium]|nr:acetyltransferase [Betaproteobacteria bacterium]